MSKRTIKLGYIHMSSWTPTSRLADDYYFNEDDSCYNEKFAKAVRALDPEEVVLQPGDYTLTITYPLRTPYVKEFVAEVSAGATDGMTRRQLVNLIVMSYKDIYDSEDDPGHVPGMLNRASSDGPYGIWGHDLSDLMLHTATVDSDGLVEVRCDS